MSRGTIERDVETLFPDQDQELICYCGGGFRSALAVDVLQADGVRERHFDGWRSTRGWDEAGYAMDGIYYHP